MDSVAALELLGRAPTVHIATTLPNGNPLLRTVHAVVVDGFLAFHGAPAGEKTEALGRTAVVCAEEVIAEIPSYFIDPERACPATTYYLSVQAHGILAEVDDLDFKTRVLAALMRKFQPEGGHVPLDPTHQLYRNVIEQILIVRMPLDRIDGKAKLGQNRSAEQLLYVLEALWKRGLPGDPRAIDLVRQANEKVPAPAFLAFPEGLIAYCALDPAAIDEVVALLADSYWNVDVPREVVKQSHLHADAWIGARDQEGNLVASARAVSDYSKVAWIYDVIVAPEWRSRGIGKALMKLMLDHPAVRHVRNVRLATKDAQGLYYKFGFVDMDDSAVNFPNTSMILRRT